jgi:hypothetical protein
MHGLDNIKTISAYTEVTLVQLVQQTDQLPFISLPILMRCSNPGTGPNFSTYIEFQMNS